MQQHSALDQSIRYYVLLLLPRGLQVANVQLDNGILGNLTNNFGTTCLPINSLVGLQIMECFEMGCFHNTFM